MINHIIHDDLNDTWDTWLIKSSSEISKWKRTHPDGFIITEIKKRARALIYSFVEKVLLKVRNSLFVKFAARNQKAYMCKGLK